MNTYVLRYSVALVLDIIGAGTLYIFNKSAGKLFSILIFFSFPLLIFVFPLFLLGKLRIALKPDPDSISSKPSPEVELNNDSIIPYIREDL